MKREKAFKAIRGLSEIAPGLGAEEKKRIKYANDVIMEMIE